MYTISIQDNRGEHYIGHRGNLADAQSLANLWVKAAIEHQIEIVSIYREGERIEVICTGYQS